MIKFASTGKLSYLGGIFGEWQLTTLSNWFYQTEQPPVELYSASFTYQYITKNYKYCVTNNNYTKKFMCQKNLIQI